MSNLGIREKIKRETCMIVLGDDRSSRLMQVLERMRV